MKRLKERAKPTSDIAAKKIFSYERATLNFIRDILDLPAKEVTILDGTQIYVTQASYDNFNTSIDVLAELDDGTQVIIEIQIVKQASFINRLWVYICKQVVDNFEKLKMTNEKTHSLYKYVKPVYSIVIFEHNYFNDDKPLHSYSLREDITCEELEMKLSNGTKRNPLKIVFLELKKYEATKIKEYNKKKWFEFFGNVEFTIEPDDLILQLESIINVKNWSKEEKSMYDEKTRMEDMRYAELEYAREEGLEKGLEKGRMEERTRLLIQSIKGMLDAGLDKATIRGILNITEQEFDSLVGN